MDVCTVGDKHTRAQIEIESAGGECPELGSKKKIAPHFSTHAKWAVPHPKSAPKYLEQGYLGYLGGRR